ncbi:MAG: hypothetical protein WCD76_14145 [Pyrinomonadaceae bacterium]
MSPRNTTASVRQRLLNLARERGEDFGLVLTHYVLERVMYRLSVSEHHEQFILNFGFGCGPHATLGILRALTGSFAPRPLH